jgi:uncharacterized membrane protein
MAGSEMTNGTGPSPTSPASPASLRPPLPQEPARAARSPLRWTLTKWFLVIAVPVGVFLVFAMPPFQGLDEPNHFMRVFTITDGTIVPPTVHGRTETVDIGGRRAVVGNVIRPHLEAKGVVVPGCLWEYYSVNINQAAHDRPMDDSTFFSTPPGCVRRPNRFVIFDNTAINSPVAYAPLVLGVGILRGLGASLPVIFYGGRLFGLAAYLALVALAIRVTPRGKGVLFVIGLLPISLEGAAVYSADSLTLALTLLTVALTIRCCVDEDAGRAQFGWLALAACGLALCKEPYGLLALMVLLVPAGRLRLTTRTAAAVKVGVVAVTGALAGTWFVAGVRGTTLMADYPRGQIDPSLQVRTFEHHPLTLVHEMLRTWLTSSEQQYTVSGMVSSLGFARNQASSELAPIVLVVLAFVLLFVAYQREWGASRQLAAPQQLVAWAPVGLTVVVALLIYLEAAIRVTAPGSLVVSPLAVQGRLFVPLLASPVVTVALLRHRRDRPMPALWLVLGVLVLSAYLVLKVFVRFY